MFAQRLAEVAPSATLVRISALITTPLLPLFPWPLLLSLSCLSALGPPP